MALVQGIYGVLPQDLPLTKLLDLAKSALDGGIQYLQLRDKHFSHDEVDARLMALFHLTTDYHATLILNDRMPKLLTGVHMGRDDFKDLKILREQCDERLLGVTCQGDLDFAGQALLAGVDYISLGAIYPTSSKQNAKTIGLSVLQQARHRFPDATIVAIGGIEVQYFPELRVAGADSVAMIQGLFGVANVEKQARLLLNAWEQAH